MYEERENPKGLRCSLSPSAIHRFLFMCECQSLEPDELLFIFICDCVLSFFIIIIVIILFSFNCQNVSSVEQSLCLFVFKRLQIKSHWKKKEKNVIE